MGSRSTQAAATGMTGAAHCRHPPDVFAVESRHAREAGGLSTVKAA